MLSSNGYIGVTSREWFQFLKDNSIIKDVNFWRKNTKDFKSIEAGSPFFFLVKNKKGVEGERGVLGYGVFKKYEILNTDKAWKKYRNKNGAIDKNEFENRIKKIVGISTKSDKIGCIILSDITFFKKPVYLSEIDIDFQNTVVSGKGITFDEVQEIILKGDKSKLELISEKLYNSELENNIKQSQKDKKKRQERLSKADKKPQIISGITTVYKRNADVIVEVLERANGICERCGNIAPFIRASDGTPYLEVHHKIPLSKGGEDTVENTIALCPNCHRELHFGVK